jgi:mRNA interferase HigB
MHVISRKKLREFWERHPDAYDSLDNWYKNACRAKWSNLIEVQAIYPKAEAVGNFTVFNIKGNTYRLIVDIIYIDQTIFVKYVLNHADYDRDKWKNDPYF